MKKIEIRTKVTSMLADVYTPVSIYLRLRDRFRDTILLESTDSHAVDKSYSFIGINAIAGIEIKDNNNIEYKYPLQTPQTVKAGSEKLQETLWKFMQKFEVKDNTEKQASFAQGLYGYFTYDAAAIVHPLTFKKIEDATNVIPTARYRLYQYVIAINHYKDELYLCENEIEGLNSEAEELISLINNKDVPTYPFGVSAQETSNVTDAEYIKMVENGIEHCNKGNVFQVVLSRRFQQGYTGDEFNVYRALRSINPSPYLFYFDYGDYKLMGSSPEAQIIIHNKKATIHPIAGTFKRTGNDAQDKQLAIDLLNDKKENAEHVMLVDLARNDLSIVSKNVKVEQFKHVQYFSHVIHLVSKVTGDVPEETNPFDVLFRTFPAGTLSGAPKHKAMQIINAEEPTARSYYGGAIGFIGFNGNCNHAIMIRTFLAKDNTLFYQAGAGVVAASQPQSELQEVNNKLNALKKAIDKAVTIK